MDRFVSTGKVSKKLVHLFEANHFSRSDRSEFWLNRPRPGLLLDNYRICTE